MSIGHDASSESHQGTTPSTNEASFQWDHTPSGTPKGALVFVFTNGTEVPQVGAVTYGGVTVPAVPNGQAIDDVGEPGQCKALFLGVSLPAGQQTVVVNRTDNAFEMYAVCVTVTSDGTPQVRQTGLTTTTGDGVPSEQNINDGSPGWDSMRYAGGYFAHDTLPTPGANSTLLHEIDFGAGGFGAVRETAAGQGSRPVGFTSGIGDDKAVLYFAIVDLGSRRIAFRRA